jgi:multicomponent Na+:H+ antiporter subunit E
MFTPATAVAASALLGIWLLLADGDAASLVIGLPAIAGALLLAQRVRSRKASAVSLRGALKFIPYFLMQSLRGGWAVAMATLSPRMRLAPFFIDYRIGLQNARSRLFFTNCVSLLPGTLATHLDGRQLRVHVLDEQTDPQSDLARLEARVGAMFPDRTTATGIDHA